MFEVKRQIEREMVRCDKVEIVLILGFAICLQKFNKGTQF